MTYGRIHRLLLLVFLPALLGMAGAPLHAARNFPPYDSTKEFEAHVRTFQSKYPDRTPDGRFFQVRTPADLPKDIPWTSGNPDLPEFGDPRATKGGTVHSPITTFPPTLRTIGEHANNGFRGYHHDEITIYPVMNHPAYEDESIPGIAWRWAVMPDRMTVFFDIDPEARFSNGDRITTRDFQMLFYVMQSPYIEDPWYNNNYTEKFACITTYGDRIYSITLPYPYPQPIGSAGVAPLCSSFFREFGPDFLKRYQWRKAPTTGAYDIDVDNGLIKGQRIIMHRVKDWWARDRRHYRYRYNADYIVFNVINNANKAFDQFLKGSVDIMPADHPRYWYDKLDDDAVNNGYIHKVQFENEYPQPSWGVYINAAIAPLDDVNVRRGIAHSINVQRIIDTELRGDFEPSSTCSEGYGRFTNGAIPRREFSAEKARECFARAGFDRPDSDGILKDKSGRRLSLTISIIDYPNHKRYALRMKEDALKAGLELKIEALDPTTLFKKEQDKKHQMAYSSWSASPPYPRYWENYHSVNAYEDAYVYEGGRKVLNPARKTKSGTNNITSTAIPELDELIDTYEKATSEDEIVRLACRIEEILHDEVVVIPTWKFPAYRTAYWRWIRWPESFNYRYTELAQQYHVHWVDQALKDETLDAMRSGRTFPPVDRIVESKPAIKAPPAAAPATAK